MTQRKSSEERVQARAIGRRLRTLRGDMSQQDFAESLGVSRSALANYELGRSTPPHDFISKVEARFGTALGAPPELADFEDELRKLVGDGSELTKDELALVRIMRLAEAEDTRACVAELVARVEQRSAGLRLGDQETTALDLARLYMIAAGKSEYQRGASGENALQLAKALAGIMKP